MGGVLTANKTEKEREFHFVAVHGQIWADGEWRSLKSFLRECLKSRVWWEEREGPGINTFGTENVGSADSVKVLGKQI